MNAERHPSRRPLVAGSILVALAIGVYLNALDNPFLYDDFFTVTGNPSIASAADLRWTLRHMPFRPVINVSYALDRALWGYRPFGYHVTSVLLHAAVSLLLFAFLRRLLSDVRRAAHRELDSGGAETWTAFAGAALFAVHPIQSETAGYVSSRSEILCGLFVLSTLLLARVATGAMPPDRDIAPGPRRRALAAAAAVGCGVLAMLSKEVAAALPVLFVAHDWLLLPGDRASKRRRVLRIFIPVALITVGLLVYRVRSLAGADASLAKAPLLNLLTQSIVIWRYLAMMALPTGQAIMHETHTVTALADPLAILAAVGLVALLVAAFVARRASPLYLLGTIWWFACIAPSSSVIALREGMAEHRVYVASAGVAIVVTGAIAQLIRRPATNGRVPLAWGTGLALLLVVCGVLTIRRNIVWDSPVTVWREAIRSAPNMWEARYALGDALREAGDCPAALIEYQAVLEKQPRLREVTTNLGICLGQVGRLPEAEAAFRQTIAIDPTWARGYTNLAAVAMLEGDPEQARDYYQRAIAVDPRNVHARVQLARIYEEILHDYDRAVKMCEEARAISPTAAGVSQCIERNQRLSRERRGGLP